MHKNSIVITGAASGIGRETALLFAQKGWYAAIFDVDEKGLRELEAEIGPEKCFARSFDVTIPESVRKGIDAFAEKTGGKLDLLLNNAGILKFGRFEDIALETHHHIVEVNFKGCLNCIHFALKYLKKTPGARIINMSSTSANYGAPELSVYAATKHALSAMTEALELELEKDGIMVCDIKPPYVRTPMLASAREIYSIRKMGVHVDPATIAETVWKAAHNKRLHWTVKSTPLISLLFRLLPFTRRAVVKKMSLP